MVVIKNLYGLFLFTIFFLDEFLLVKVIGKTTNSVVQHTSKTPTQADIDNITKRLPQRKRINLPIVNIEELVLQSDVSLTL